MLPFIDPEMVNNRGGLRGDTSNPLGRGSRLDFADDLEAEGDGNRRNQEDNVQDGGTEEFER